MSGRFAHSCMEIDTTRNPLRRVMSMAIHESRRRAVAGGAPPAQEDDTEAKQAPCGLWARFGNASQPAVGGAPLLPEPPESWGHRRKDRRGIVATKATLDTDGPVWAVPAPLLALMIG